MNLYVWSVIIGGCIVTVIPRVLPITILSKIKLNRKVEEFLTYIPISILAALIAVEIFTDGSKLSVDRNYVELLGAIPTVLVALKKNNLLLTVLVGIISIGILRAILN
ncbi:AzlD domain-containing protein [Clostridium saccharobutylicum]|uniref:Branched-chain amino acid transport protein AzlD n=1 Tax=Clostridium saccharobutylicum TaxID=169679 RepID=A0A1S8NI93_CLOSA|nr:AzlD domain-containing protein [Clostridium saccharobutylicum]OOM16196.1 branched-chain amino acid transport protein AzlD [Clostridium saccharobutylicum]